MAEGIRDGVFHGTPEGVTQYVWAVYAGYRSALAREESPPKAVAAMIVDLLLHGIGARTAGGDDG